MNPADLSGMLVQGIAGYAIFVLDPDGIVRSWNTGAERIKGYTAEEIIGQHFSRFYTPEDRDAGKPASMMAAALRDGTAWDEGWRVRKDGSRFWASVEIDVIRGPDGSPIGFAKVTRDITKQLHIQAQLDQAREQLFQAQKMEAVGNLTGGIAHDFNNLLTIIRGSIELAERHAAGNEKLQRLLTSVQGAVTRAVDLTQHMLAFSRRQQLRSEIIDLTKHLVETATMLDRTLRGDISTLVETPAGLWPVEIDPRQFELALLNVGMNARDAMPQGGIVTMRARNETIRDHHLGLDGDFVRLSISDQGFGIPPHLLSKVIEPFFTTKEVGKGSGLGLSQAYGFAQQSGGTLTVQSTLGEGTTVTFYLPARRDASRHMAELPADHPDAPLIAKGRVLIVEDDLMVADVADTALRDHGYETTVAHCPMEALALIKNGREFDLIFSDIIMPGEINGVQLAQRISAAFPALPILLTTGYSEAAISDAAKRFPLIAKPYRLIDMIARIAGMIEATEGVA